MISFPVNASLTTDDREGCQNGVHVVAPDAIEVEVGGNSLRWRGASCNTPRACYTQSDIYSLKRSKYNDRS